MPTKVLGVDFIELKLTSTLPPPPFEVVWQSLHSGQGLQLCVGLSKLISFQFIVKLVTTKCTSVPFSIKKKTWKEWEKLAGICSNCHQRTSLPLSFWGPTVGDPQTLSLAALLSWCYTFHSVNVGISACAYYHIPSRSVCCHWFFKQKSMDFCGHKPFYVLYYSTH